MAWFLIYIVFALATAASATYELFWPLLKLAQAAEVENEFTEHPLLSTAIFFVIQVIIAPLVVFMVFIPPMYAAMYRGMEREMMRGKINT